MVAKKTSRVVTLPPALAAKHSLATALITWDEDGLVTDVYRTWSEAEGGYEVSDRVSMSWDDYGLLQDFVPNAQPEAQIDARYASRWTRKRAAGREDEKRGGERARYEEP